ncbi:hypothetical protein MMC34_006409 [Xylographa carneopallida]|nr:hypothetical protein [Xylographa carneopallida]
MAHQPQKTTLPLATSGDAPSGPTPSRKSPGDNPSLRETLQVARRRSKEWPWEVRLLHMGGYLAAAKVVAPAIRQVRRHDAAGETASLAERGALLNDTGSIAERGSVAGTSLAGTSVLN